MLVRSQCDQAAPHAFDFVGPVILATCSGSTFTISRRAVSASAPTIRFARTRLRDRSVTVRMRYMTASTSPQARLQPSAAIETVRISSCPAVAIDSEPTMVTAMISAEQDFRDPVDRIEQSLALVVCHAGY